MQVAQTILGQLGHWQSFRNEENMKSSPFARAIAPEGANAAPMKRGEYESRGKGRGGHSGKKWGPRPSGKYAGVTNGRRECERRMRQMAA